MSCEFRWVDGGYFYRAIADAGESAPAQHEVTNALTELYAALAPIERACAGFEESDYGPGAPPIALLQNLKGIEAVVSKLQTMARGYEDIIHAGAAAAI